MAKEPETFVINIDVAEAACRLAEAMFGSDRPPGRTAEDCLQSLPDDVCDNLVDAASAVIAYVVECHKDVMKDKLVSVDKVYGHGH